MIQGVGHFFGLQALKPSLDKHMEYCVTFTIQTAFLMIFWTFYTLCSAAGCLVSFLQTIIIYFFQFQPHKDFLGAATANKPSLPVSCIFISHNTYLHSLSQSTHESLLLSFCLPRAWEFHLEFPFTNPAMFDSSSFNGMPFLFKFVSFTVLIYDYADHTFEWIFSFLFSF